MHVKPPRQGGIKHHEPPAPRANFEEATLWTKFAYCELMLGFVLLLFSFSFMTTPGMNFGGIATEICLLISFFSYLAGVLFVLVLVYVVDARDNKLVEMSVMFFCFFAALMMAIAISIWGGDAASKREYINMVPVGISVSSVVLALLAGIFATLELFNVGRNDSIFSDNRVASKH